jgi:hypothetical protein
MCLRHTGFQGVWKALPAVRRTEKPPFGRVEAKENARLPVWQAGVRPSTGSITP